MEGSFLGGPSLLPNLPPWEVGGVSLVQLSHFSRYVQHLQKSWQCNPSTDLLHVSMIQCNLHQQECMAASQPH